MYKHLFWFCLAVATSALLTATLFSHPNQEDAEGQQAASAAKKFHSILEKNPQRGIALEKVFSFHLQHGSLDDFVADLQKRAQSDPDDGVTWMMLGLFESQRRQDQQAILAFQRAETLRPTDSLPAYYRGQCLLRIGEPDTRRAMGRATEGQSGPPRHLGK